MTSALELFDDFLNFDAREVEKKSALATSEQLLKMGEQVALETFSIAAKTVPAYKDFLKKNKIDSEKIKSFSDFTAIPLTNKENYLFAYPLRDLLLGGSYSGNSAITSSSGSSGQPLYWPRVPAQDFGATKGLNGMVVSLFEIDKKTTLHMNCSGLGVWTAGDYISILIKYLSYKYKNNSSIAPGIDLDNTIRAITDLGSDFEQVIIYGYPPFIKDLVDNLSKNVIEKTSIKIVVYGESFTESWRDYILKKLGRKKDEYRTVASLLGSSEGGLVGSEVANAIYIRRQAVKNDELCLGLFGEKRIPSLVQFNPASKFIEVVGSQIVLTARTGLPLLRFDTKDYGGLLKSEEIEEIFKEKINKSFSDELKKLKIVNSKLPYVYLFGRSDYTATIYGVLIYPEMIKEIIAKDDFSEYLSGKFVMKTDYDKMQNQYLKLVCEVKRGGGIDNLIFKSFPKKIAEELQKISSEFGKLYDSMGERVVPNVEFRKYADPEFFNSRNKQKYLV